MKILLFLMITVLLTGCSKDNIGGWDKNDINYDCSKLPMDKHLSMERTFVNTMSASNHALSQLSSSADGSNDFVINLNNQIKSQYCEPYLIKGGKRVNLTTSSN